MPPYDHVPFQKFARKHHALLATAAAVAASLMLGTTVSAWQAVRGTNAEAQATANEVRAEANARKAEEKAQEATQERDAAQKQRDEVRALNEKLQATQAEQRRTLYAAHINLGIQEVLKSLDSRRSLPRTWYGEGVTN